MSRGLHDRVSEAVHLDEHGLGRRERVQALAETKLSMQEQELVEREEQRGRAGRHKQADDKLKVLR